MAKVMFVNKEDREVLSKYIGSDRGGVILVMTDGAVDKAKESGIDDGDVLDDYDFGGEADLWVETVSSESHYMFDKGD